MTDGTASAVNQELLNEVTVVIVTFNSAHCLPELGRHLDVNYRWPPLNWNSHGPAVSSGPACVGFICGAALLLHISAFDSFFFDEQFFLYYVDDDLCTRLFNQRQAVLIDPASTATHRFRGSVRGKSPLRSECLRGYHHTQSKLIYTRKYKSLHTAIQQQGKLLRQTELALPLRVLAFNPRLLAHMWGRFIGVTDWKTS